MTAVDEKHRLAVAANLVFELPVRRETSSPRSIRVAPPQCPKSALLVRPWHNFRLRQPKRASRCDRLVVARERRRWSPMWPL